MGKAFCLAGLAATVLALVGSSTIGAATPTVKEHVNFTSDPYLDNWCGIAGTSVDRVVAHYSEDASGASIETVSVLTTFTATTSGKSMAIRVAGVGKVSALIDNGDGTYSVLSTSSGLRPQFKLPTGEIVNSAGTAQFLLTFDAATGDFLSFEVVALKGHHPPACDLIVAALS